MLASLAAAVLAAAGSAAVRAVEPSDSPNRLDHPYRDLMMLDPAGPDGAPRLLAIDAIEPAVGTVHLSILERDRSWSEVRSLDVGLDAPAPGIDRPWLVPLGPTTVAMLVDVPATEATQVVLLRTDGGSGGDELIEVDRTELPGLVIAGGAADVDADGVQELILAGQRGCTPATIWRFRPSTFPTVDESYAIAGRGLRGGVIGRWDDVPGDDLLVYASHGCQPSAGQTSVPVLVDAIRLIDGTPIVSGLDVLAEQVDFLGAPLRIDLDAGDPGAPPVDEAVIRGRSGLALLDLSDEWRLTTLSRGESIPLGIVSDPGSGGSSLVFIDFEQDGVAVRTTVRRAPDGVPEAGDRIALPVSDQEPDRVRRLAGQAAIGSMTGRPGVVWQGAVQGEDCPDVLIQGARILCDADAIEPGAAWLGTRPLATIGEGSDRRLLVAAGMESDRTIGLPIVPTPAATGLAGWWRQGPSAAFALAEVRAGDAVYYNEFPEPRSSVERVSNPDATTAVPGFTGSRLLVRADATTTGQEPSRDLSPEEVFSGEVQANELRTILRIPVPPGLDSGRDGAAVLVPLSRATLPDGTPGTRWTMQVVPVNDWGEVGPMAVGLVARDSTGPTLVVGEPFTTPVWPLPARLTGSAEPGSTVVVDGVGEAPLDRRGGFAFQTTLAPWPQTIRVTATDASGNQTVRELSIVGGVDYRRFPWTVIAAVAIVIAVGASGFRGVRRRPVAAGLAGSGGAVSLIEEWPVAELEELEPGSGLPRGGGGGPSGR